MPAAPRARLKLRVAGPTLPPDSSFALKANRTRAISTPAARWRQPTRPELTPLSHEFPREAGIGWSCELEAKASQSPKRTSNISAWAKFSSWPANRIRRTTAPKNSVPQVAWSRHSMASIGGSPTIRSRACRMAATVADFLPAFGDAMVKRFGVPIGVASTGAGATSVRQWLPQGEKMTRPPTIAAYVKLAGPGQWESTGQLYDGLIRRIDALGPHGFRAILWHQGESDAGQARAGYGAEKQISGEQYRVFLEKLILATRRHAGWDIPWFVARATYHSEQDAADEEFRAAELAICKLPAVDQGPARTRSAAAFVLASTSTAKAYRPTGDCGPSRSGRGSKRCCDEQRCGSIFGEGKRPLTDLRGSGSA